MPADIDINDSAVEPTTIPAAFERTVAACPDREAVVDSVPAAHGEDIVRLKYDQLSREVDRTAQALMASGVGHGTPVAIWAPNIHEWVTAALAVWGIGGILVPINTRYKAHEAAEILGRSGAEFLFTVDEFLGNDYVAMLERESVNIPTVILRGADRSGTTPLEDFLARAASVDTDALSARRSAVLPDDVSELIFTSGTTGRPKGVMSTHSQNVRVNLAWADTVGMVREDRQLVINPFFHSFGLRIGILASVFKGATIVPERFLDPDILIRHLSVHRVTVLPTVPTVYQTLLEHPDRHKYDLSALRLAVTGGAAVPVRLIERMRDELAFQTVVTAYGLSEATGTVTSCRPNDAPETVARTSGRAIPGVEVRIVDKHGRDVLPGEPGEVWCRGYNVMKGYFDDPVATAAAVDPDGWLHTGDIGTLDAGGYLAITDRLKDMYIIGGYNAYPAEIENIMLLHPAIERVAVIGVPDDRLGEVGHAFVVLRSGERTTEQELIAWCREEMANFKVPRAVHFVAELPMNATGKVLKGELRKVLESQCGPGSGR